jgi:hypothetical protein
MDKEINVVEPWNGDGQEHPLDDDGQKKGRQNKTYPTLARASRCYRDCSLSKSVDISKLGLHL